MIVFWAKASAAKTLAAVNQATRNYPDLPIRVVSSMEGIPNPPGMTVLVSMGTEPLAVLAEAKVVPKNRTMTSLRTQALNLPNTSAKVLVTYSPGIGEVDYGHFVDLQCDAGAAVRLALTGSMAPKYGQYQYVDSFAGVRAQIEHKFNTDIGYDGKVGHPVNTSLDLETIGLDPYALPTVDHPGARIVCMQVTFLAGHSDAVYFDSREHEVSWLRNLEYLSDLAWLLSSPKVKLRGANLKFDLHWLFVRAGIECTNFVFDTTLVGSLLDENRGNGLDIHTKIYVQPLGGYSDHFDRTVDKSRMDLVPKADMLPYACGDTDACYQVADAQKVELLKDERLTKFYVHILHPAARAFEKLERTGVLVDQNAYAELRADLVHEVAGLLVEAKKILGGRIVAKHYDADKPGGLNLSKASMINDFMFSPMGLNLKPQMTTAKTGAPSSALDHLLMFADVPEASAFISLYKDYASATKTLSTYVDGFLSHLRSDGRFHPAYWFFAGNKDNGDGGTSTGRLSAHGPAYQTIPKHTKWAKRLRRCYIAPSGYVMVERDFQQGELRVVACIAHEITMINAYRQGLDLHCLTGSKLAGISYEALMALQESDPDKFDAIRQPAKPCIAEGQLVLTDSGPVPIEQVTSEHKVWDGISWVSQSGAIDKGEKYVMEYRGLKATPDHFVFTPMGAMPLYLAWELGVPLVTKVPKANRDIHFYYADLKETGYLKEYLYEGCTTADIIEKARGYGFRDYRVISLKPRASFVFKARCAVAKALGRARSLL